MAQSKSRSNSPRRSARAAAPASASKPSTPRPGGKLGLIVDRLSGKSGSTADELPKATGWQRPSVLGALSRLKARGFALRLDAQSDRKAYRLAASGR